MFTHKMEKAELENHLSLRIRRLWQNLGPLVYIEFQTLEVCIKNWENSTKQ